MKKQRKVVVNLEYYFIKRYVCKICGKVFEKPNTEHITKYHSDELNFEEHMEAHKNGNCKCSGVVMEV